MPLTVVLEDEFGNARRGVAEVILPSGAVSTLDDRVFVWASTIDPYGNTTFNSLQARRLRKEWSRLIASASDPATVAALEGVDRLLQRCAEGIHLYVKFIGD